MAKTKISEYSATAGSNTDINSINLAEGMAPSLVNNAIRQLMAQLKDFQVGTAGDNLTVGGNLAVTGTSTFGGAISAVITGGSINNTAIGGTTPAAGAFTTLSSSNATITGGSITGITDLAVADGGTGASTAQAALNNLLPSQASANNKYLQSDGTNASWDAVSLSTADITGTLAVLNGGTGTTTPSLVQGTNVTITGTWPNQTISAVGTGFGDVIGPASATANNLAAFDGTTGKIIKQANTVTVAQGGTGISSGTSGGILAYTASGTLASSGVLAQYGVVLGGGAGAVPTSTAVGTATQVLTSNGAGVAPTFQSLPASGVSAIELFFYANANA